MAAKHQNQSIGKAVVDLWRTVTTDLFGTYHPERHYMRGPGPKWRAKHTRTAVTAEPDLGGMVKIAG